MKMSMEIKIMEGLDGLYSSEIHSELILEIYILKGEIDEIPNADLCSNRQEKHLHSREVKLANENPQSGKLSFKTNSNYFFFKLFKLLFFLNSTLTAADFRVS